MREDTRTTTLADAGAYERHRGGGWGADPDLPTSAEVGEAAELDRWLRAQEQREEDAARARGEYVPSTLMKLGVSMLRWRHPWAHAAREDATHGVVWIQGETPETVGLDDRYEVAPGNDGVWVRFPLSMVAPPW